MKLSSAFRIQAGEIVSFVGGGGKTTAMFRLAAELAQAGQPVITTTTTRIFAAQTGLAPAHLACRAGEPPDYAAIQAALAAHGHVLVTGQVDRTTRKAVGLDPTLIPELARLPGVPAVLVEADGARMRPLKAPAGHEPVIPLETTLVVPVMGADVLGQPLAEARVHRKELVQALTGAQEGDPVTPELAARLLAHPDGGLKNVPPAARVMVLINKVEGQAVLDLARQTGAQLLKSARTQAVVLAAARQAEPDPVREVWGRLGGVVLAAGRSTRMGRPKQLLPWGQGSTMLAEVIGRLRAGGIDDLVVVTGTARELIEAALAPLNVPHAFNPDFENSEMARSLQVGLQALPANCLAALVALGDQPQLQPEVVRAVVQRWRATQAAVVAPVFRGQRGHPMLFDRRVWPELNALAPGSNPREVLSGAAHIEWVEVESDSILRDVDTPEAYARERART